MSLFRKRDKSSDEFPGELSDKKLRKLYASVGQASLADDLIRGRHAHALAERSHSVEFSDFKAFQLCPACNSPDWHGMEKNISKRTTNVIRVCNNCDWEWLQE